MSDINLLIIDRNRKEHKITAPTDMALNLMEVIRLNNIEEEGTIGVCGGMAMCASCHCYILSKNKLNNKTDDEDAMLSEAFNIKENSRLSCQIPITKETEGLKIEIAPE